MLQNYSAAGRWRLPVCLFLATVAAGYAAYLSVLTGFASYDDEGYLLITVKQFVEGGVLYNQIYSQYGPFYYLCEWIVHSLAGAPVTHEAVRLGLLAPWLGTSLVCAWLAWRILGSVFFAVLAHFLVFALLHGLTYEPGHPNELCILLLAVLAAVFATGVAPGRKRVLAMAAAGFCSAALLLTKINAGTYACAALGLLLAAFTAGRRLPHLLYLAAATVSMAIPVILFSVHLESAWGLRFFFVVQASIGAAVLVSWRLDCDQPLRPRDWGFLLAGFAIVFCASIAFVLARGSSIAALLNSTVLENLGVARRWYLPLNMRITAVPWALAALVLATAYTARERLSLKVAAALEHGIPWAKLAYGLAVCAVSLGRPDSLLTYGAPFIWLVAVAPGAPIGQQFTRTAVALLGALQSLYAFPVAGMQIRFATVLIVVAGVICLADGLRWLAQWVPARRPVHAMAGLLLLVAYAGYFGHDYREHFSNKLPLGLPGASRVRVDPQQWARLHWLAESTAKCDTFISTPGLDSLYFWTRKEPPTGINVDNWMNLLTDSEQESIVSAFSTHPQACVLYSPEELKLWLRGQDLGAMPLGRYILDHFHTVEQRYGYLLMMRNDRTGSLGTADRRIPLQKNLVGGLKKGNPAHSF